MQQNNNHNGGEIVIAKFNYTSQENHELTINKNERLILLDDTCLWWKVKRVDSDETGYIPSNFARREKRSLLDKIISKRIAKKQIISNGYNTNINDRSISLALVKFRYDAESEDEISLDKGIWVSILQKKSDGWWLVQYEKQRGWFPSNYLVEKTSDSFNSLSLLNQLNNQHTSPSSSSNGLSSSSSANSNLIENPNLQQIRHNSHPSNPTNNHDEYAFVIKPSKFAHSDGRLDTCNNNLIEEQKMNSCSALIQHNDYPTIINNGFKTLTLNNSPYINEIWYYGLLSRDEAEKYLKLYGNEKGDFLIRDSERRIGNYSLSIRDDVEIIRHFRIELSKDGHRYLIGKRAFKSLNDLIEHYKTHPVFDADQNNKLYLNKPLIINDHQS